MSFKLEEIYMDLGNTPIENIFINDYMPGADGTYVKVYLLGFKFAGEKEEYSNKVIAKHLNILESDVLSAWDYWEEQGIIEKHEKEGSKDFEIIFLNLKQIYINNIYTNNSQVLEAQKNKKKRENYSTFVNSLSDPVVANLFSKIDYYMRREVSYTQKQDVAAWIEVYNMPPDLIEEAFFYCTEIKNIRKIKYVEAVVRNWADSNIRTMEEIEQSYREHEEGFYRYNKVKRALGLTRKEYIATDLDLVGTWFDEMGYSMEMVLKACERSANTRNPNFSYINGILKSWFEKGIKTVEDIEKLDVKEKRTRSESSGFKATKFHNFSQRSDKYTDKELEDIARKKREKFMKSKG